MDAIACLREMRRMCLSMHHCRGCPLSALTCPLFFGFTCGWNEKSIVSAVETWSQQNPLPKRNSVKIVADEVVRVYTFEATDIVDAEADDPHDVKATGSRFADRIKDRYDFDDVICTKAQQFITRFHEEEG